MVKKSFKSALAVLLITSAVTPVTFGQLAHAYTEAEIKAMLEDQKKFEAEQKQAAEDAKKKDREVRVTEAREKMVLLQKADELTKFYNNHMQSFLEGQMEGTHLIFTNRTETLAESGVMYDAQVLKKLQQEMAELKTKLPEGYEFLIANKDTKALDNFLFLAHEYPQIREDNDAIYDKIFKMEQIALDAKQKGIAGAEELSAEALRLKNEFSQANSITKLLMRMVARFSFDIPFDKEKALQEYQNIKESVETSYNSPLMNNIIAQISGINPTIALDAAVTSPTASSQTPSNNATDNVDRLVNIPVGIPLGTGTKAYTLTIDGRQMAMFVNYDTGNVVGYGYTGIGGKTVAPLTASEMDYSQGAFVGKINANGTQIIGEFLGITGASAFDNDFQTINIANHDAIALRVVNLPRAAIQDGGTGSVLAHIPTVIGSTGIDRTLSFTAAAGTTNPYKLGNGSILGTSSNTPVTWVGYGRVLSQNRVAKTVGTPVVMDDLGDLKVTVDSTKGSENVTFNFNSTNPQATAIKAVVNDRIAAGLGQLGNNVMRTGVMFPLENYEHTNLVHFTDFVQGMNNATPNDIGYGFGVVGTPTLASDLPAGTATYNGGAAGYVTSQNYGPGTVSHMEQFYGNTALNVNFGTSAATGTINTFRNLDDSAIDSFNVTGSVTGNGIGFTMTNAGAGTGAGAGTFFGPAANELGGQFTTTNGTTTQDGVFWGAR